MNIKQIGVMWSTADPQYPEQLALFAYQLWKEIAQSWYTLVYGAEKDVDSLSATAARWAKSQGWLVMGITYGKTPQLWWDMNSYTDCVVCTGMERGGGREFVLVSSCDAIIVLSGGAGTLNEIAVAYQKKIPIVCMKWSWWWADKVDGVFLDERYKTDPKRFVCYGVETPQQAIDYLKSL